VIRRASSLMSGLPADPRPTARRSAERMTLALVLRRRPGRLHCFRGTGGLFRLAWRPLVPAPKRS
jgi:hypothetical protein